MHSYSAGIIKRVARASAVVPFEQAAAQVSMAVRSRWASVRPRSWRWLGDRFRCVLRRAAPGSVPGRHRVAAHRGRVRVRRAAAGTTARDRPGGSGPGRAGPDSGWPGTPPTCASPGNAPPSWPASPTSRPPRTADDVIITALFSTAPRAARTGDSDAARHGPKAGGKTVFASARKPIPQVIADAFAEAQRRDPGHARPWFAVRPPSSAGCGRGSKRQ